MTADAFIRATEVWVPTKDRSRLELGSGRYGPLTALEARSRAITFGYGEGLPGHAWAAGEPIVLKDLVNSYFRRGDEASEAALKCGVAIPIFAGEFLLAVVVLLCGTDEDHAGAIELWETPPGSNEMALVDGYFGRAQSFEFRARHVKFMRGFGLPGLVWESGLPFVMEDLGHAKRFLRGDSAQKVGINRGIGIPCQRDGGPPRVVTLLSALNTPIALRFECWLPNADRSALVFGSGFCEVAGNLEAPFAGVAIARGDDTLSQVWRSGVPAVRTGLADEPAPIASSAAQAGLSTMVALPVIARGTAQAIVAWYL